MAQDALSFALLSSLALLAFTYLGYPIGIAMLARWRPRPVAADRAYRPSLSVVIAARDEAAVLGGKIESLLDQAWPEERLEIVIVDDGSRDGTADIAAAWAGRTRVRIRVLRLAEPRGKAEAQNAGVLQSGGEILVFTDSGFGFDSRLLAPIRSFHAENGQLPPRVAAYRFVLDP